MSKLFTRRESLRIMAGTGIGLGLHRLGAAENGMKKAFSFIAVNDLHYLEAGCAPWFERVVAEMKKSAPEAAFCLLSGDLSDLGKPEQLTAVRDIFGGLKIPLHAVPGNHDFLTPTDRAAYDKIFPDQLNYSFEYQGWQFVGLDTTEGQKFHDTVIGDATLNYVDEALRKLDAKKPTVAFTHFPLGEGVQHRPKNADALVKKLGQLNLRGTFGGHWHGLSERALGEAALVTDRCCARVRDNHDGSKQKGWFVCDASADGKLTHRFVEFTNAA